MARIVNKPLFKSQKKVEFENEDSMKKLILLIAFTCCFCGLIWSVFYYFIFGLTITSILPFAFLIIVGSAIVYTYISGNHKPLIITQLFCITWISAFIQWSIGSYDNSGVVIAWSFLGPLGALIFLSVRQSVLWMVMFLVIVIISAFINESITGQTQLVSQNVKMIFYIMNLGTALAIVFYASLKFVKTIQFERGRAEGLLQKIRVLFGQHVSDEVANELISKDIEKLESKTYEVTIMFLDIRDFTVFADSRTPKEVANYQNTVFSELINIVRENRGIVNQILGDGIMAVFGAPTTNENHVQDAVKSGYAMINRLKTLSDREEIPATKIGIGLHTGNVIAGEVGNEFRKFYSLAGTNVIIAARIEQLNKELKSQFLVSQAVYDVIQDLDYKPTYQGQKELKGISDPVGIYQLV